MRNKSKIEVKQKVEISDEKEEEKESDARAIESALPKNHSEQEKV